MEALAAVGLAGNVVQFLQFSHDLIRITKEIKRTGQPSSLHELRELTQTLLQHSTSIKSRLELSKCPLQQEEHRLLRLARDCCATGDEVIKYIDELTISNHSPGIVNSLKSSLRVKWQHGRLEEYARSLQNLQGSLVLATTLALRSRTATNDREILEHLKKIGDEMQSAHKADSQLSDAIKVVTDAVQEQSGSKFDTMQREIEHCLEGIKSLGEGLDISFSREREILNWLQFRQRSWRYHEIEEAHQKTFGWIFKKPSNDTPWHEFALHLSDPGIKKPYFINGKAGSGKSTLMKFLWNHDQTRQELEKWSKQTKLLMLNVFFWNLGTEYQKNRAGMLRSLLYGLFAAHPELMPAAFPELYSNRLNLEEPPNFFELEKAFEIAKSRSAAFLRLCIFVDGIDEYDGDHRDMAEFVKGMVSANIKVIASSRPINACMSIFRDCPTLKLQDLTARDMKIFIEDKLASHEMMDDMRIDFPDEVHKMVNTIQEKAEGVFLWVRLVVKLLLRGLEDGDEMNDLMAKLYSLPSDLRKLYSRMLKQMQPEYQVQASQMFQIFEAWRALTQEQPMEVLILAFAVRPLQFILDHPIKPISKDEKRRLIDRTEARIRSRGCGLLEVRTFRSELASQPPKQILTYLHRSVSEFLELESAWPEIKSLTKGTHFDPSLWVALGLLCNLKTSDWVIQPDLHGCFRRLTDPVEHNLELMMAFCRATVDASESHLRSFMEELDHTMSALGLEICDHPRWQTNGQNNFSTMKYLSDSQISRKDLDSSLLVRYLQTNLDWHWSAYAQRNLIQMDTIRDPSHMKMLYEMASRDTYAAYAGFHQYIRHRYHPDHDTEPPLPAQFMLIFALQSWNTSEVLLLGNVPLSARSATLQLLLENIGGNGDATLVRVFDSTVWDHCIVMANHLINQRRNNASDTRELIRLAVAAARDPEALFEKPTECLPSVSAATLGLGSYSDFQSTIDQRAQKQTGTNRHTATDVVKDPYSAEQILATRLSSHPLNHYYSMEEEQKLDETTYLPIVRRLV